MPYSLTPDNIDASRIQAFVAYFAPTRKPVYIDEWGLQTTGLASYGVAPNEAEKGRLLLDLVRLAQAAGLDWTYFMLIDRVPSISFERGIDWGLLNLDRTPRASAIALAEFLKRR